MTIEVPTPAPEFLEQVEKALIETDQAEAAAITAIRERFAVYARHNGFIQTASYDESDGANYSIDREAHLMDGGRCVRAIRAASSFTTKHTSRNRGTCGGYRLYLTEKGEWIEVQRVGVWSAMQGEPGYWFCDEASADAIGMEHCARYGHVRRMSDEEVADEYDLDAIVEHLGKSMAELVTKLPARYTNLQARAELAQRVIAAAKEGK